MIRKTVTFLLHNEEQLIAKDTEANNYGTHAFDEFKAEKIVPITTEAGDKYFVPFHAIIWAKVVEERVEPSEVVDANCNYAGC